MFSFNKTSQFPLSKRKYTTNYTAAQTGNKVTDVHLSYFRFFVQYLSYIILLINFLPCVAVNVRLFDLNEKPSNFTLCHGLKSFLIYLQYNLYSLQSIRNHSVLHDQK